MQSLRAKLIAPFMIGTLLLTLLLAWYTYSSARKAVEDAMLLISEAKTAHASSSISLLYKSMFTNAQNMAVDPHVTGVFSSDMDPAVLADTAEWLEIITHGNEFYRDILIVDTSGVCLVSSNPGRVGTSYRERPYVREALKGMFSLGEPTVGKVTKRFSAVIAGPVDAKGQVAGALVMMNDFPKIVDYDTVSDHDNQAIFTALLTPAGLFAAHKDKELMGNRGRLFSDLYTRLSEAGEQGGVVSYTLEGRRYTGYARVEPTSKWVVLTSGMEKEVFAPAYKVGFTVFGISFAFLCAIAAVVVRVANGILRALFSLIEYAREVSEGDFQRDLADTDRKDELGVLHHALQRLVQALRSMLQASQQANVMKGQFLANMSHEIRTPLNAIIGMTHLSLRDSAMPPKQRDYLEKIQTAARSLLGLINDILDLSKVEAGMLELEEASFNLRDTMEDTLSIHMENARAKNINLSMRYDPALPQHFIGDPLRIGQVLNNLLSNAIKFTASGAVTVDCSPAAENEIPAGEGRPNGVFLRVSVADTGIGISQEKIGDLFRPFIQADASTSRQFGGTGLGLAISDRIVHLLGGDFTVTSVQGQGTTFSFTMCLAVDEAGASRTDEEIPLEEAFARLDLAGKRILVAEDNAINQMIMRELVAPSGATVVTADNGQEAVDAVRDSMPDLVFMDLQMPIMDGLEATRKIREFAAMDALPIIAVTANAMKEDKAQGFASGMNDYITKPIDPRHLLDMLRIWLKRD